FPAKRDGEEICLCWKLGEPSVGFWHTVDGGFNGRMPLTNDKTDVENDVPQKE
ncbi:DUF2203 family protein, partial [Klebsiella pneumoniae]|uniref:DUF2203 family protein n=1 Tax=Klebsiella pneumoniae TaxID=573 RepID=UPI0038548AD9